VKGGHWGKVFTGEGIGHAEWRHSGRMQGFSIGERGRIGVQGKGWVGLTRENEFHRNARSKPHCGETTIAAEEPLCMVCRFSPHQ